MKWRCSRQQPADRVVQWAIGDPHLAHQVEVEQEPPERAVRRVRDGDQLAHVGDVARQLVLPAALDVVQRVPVGLAVGVPVQHLEARPDVEHQVLPVGGVPADVAGALRPGVLVHLAQELERLGLLDHLQAALVVKRPVEGAVAVSIEARVIRSVAGPKPNLP